MARVTRTISFDGHPQALAIIERLPRGERSAYVCRAIEALAGQAPQGITLADVLHEVQAIRALIRAGALALGPGAPEAARLPDEVNDRLGRLGL